MNLKDKISPLIKGEAHWDQKINKTVDTITDYLVEGPDYIVRSDLNTVVSPDIDMISPASDIEIHGRTLINLLGRSGNAIYQQFTNTDCKGTLEYNCDEFIISDTTAGAWISNTDIEFVKGKILLVIGKGYYESGDKVNGAFINITSNVTEHKLKTTVDVGIWNTIYHVSTISDPVDGHSKPYFTMAVGDENPKARFKDIAIYEITQEIYDKINIDPEYTGDKLAEKYPYVDDVKCVVNPYIECKENLLDGVNWYIGGYTNSGSQVSPGGGDSIACLIHVPLEPQPYTLNLTGQYSKLNLTLKECVNGKHVDVLSLKETDILSSTGIPTGGSIWGLYTNIEDTSIDINSIIDSINSGMTRITLVKGTTPKTYEECHNSQIMFETKMYTDEKITRTNDGTYVKNSIWGDKEIITAVDNGKVVAQGSSTHKGVFILKSYFKDMDKGFVVMSACIGYNGEVIPYGYINDRPSFHYTLFGEDECLYITVPNQYSGWGPNYTPTPEEVKAYFLGWKMYTSLEGSSINYNGTGAKCWSKIWCGVGVKLDTSHGAMSGCIKSTSVSVCPTIMNDMGYKPYRLVYKKEITSLEEVKTHGSLNIKPNVDVKISSGLVLGEKNITQPNINIQVHSNGDLGSKFVNRCDNTISIYSKNNTIHNFSSYYFPEASLILRYGNSQPQNIGDNKTVSHGEVIYVDYFIYKPDTITSFNCKLSLGTNVANVLEKTVEELSYTNNKLSEDNRQLNDDINQLRQLSNPNLLINGDFQVWQRGDIVSVIASQNYGPGRWVSTAFDKMMKTDKGVEITRNVSNQAYFRQRVPKEVLSKLKNRDITFSIRTKGKKIGLEIYDRKNSKAIYHTSRQTHESFTTFILTVKNFDFNSNVGYLEFSMVSQEVNGGPIEIEWAKLEIGDIATPFVPRSYQEELADCQRYFETASSTAICTGPKSVRAYIDYAVEKRINPTITHQISKDGLEQQFMIISKPSSMSGNMTKGIRVEKFTSNENLAIYDISWTEGTGLDPVVGDQIVLMPYRGKTQPWSIDAEIY